MQMYLFMSLNNEFILCYLPCNKVSALISRVSCQKGPTRHAYAWWIGPFWQDTLESGHAGLHLPWLYMVSNTFCWSAYAWNTLKKFCKIYGPFESWSSSYVHGILQGPGLLKNFHVKIHVSWQRFSNLACDWLVAQPPSKSHVVKSLLTDINVNMDFPGHWPAHRAGLLCCNFFGQPGSVSKFPPFVWVKLWVGWVGRGYTEISRYFPASWINWVTLVTKIKLLYSLRF